MHFRDTALKIIKAVTAKCFLIWENFLSHLLSLVWRSYAKFHEDWTEYVARCQRAWVLSVPRIMSWVYIQVWLRYEKGLLRYGLTSCLVAVKFDCLSRLSAFEFQDEMTKFVTLEPLAQKLITLMHVQLRPIGGARALDLELPRPK